jgi:hypothetical protein
MPQFPIIRINSNMLASASPFVCGAKQFDITIVGKKLGPDDANDFIFSARDFCGDLISRQRRPLPQGTAACRGAVNANHGHDRQQTRSPYSLLREKSHLPSAMFILLAKWIGGPEVLAKTVICRQRTIFPTGDLMDEEQF